MHFALRNSIERLFRHTTIHDFVQFPLSQCPSIFDFSLFFFHSLLSFSSLFIRSIAFETKYTPKKYNKANEEKRKTCDFLAIFIANSKHAWMHFSESLSVHHVAVLVELPCGNHSIQLSDCVICKRIYGARKEHQPNSKELLLKTKFWLFSVCLCCILASSSSSSSSSLPVCRR